MRKKAKLEMKKFQEIVIEKVRFAIFLDDESQTAHEAVWDCKEGRWETDFSYLDIGVDSIDVAEALDFDTVKKMGYRFLS